MNGAEHYKEAERLLVTAFGVDGVPSHIAAAQVHATLALAAATAYPAVKDYLDDEACDSREWSKVTAPNPQAAAS